MLGIVKTFAEEQVYEFEEYSDKLKEDLDSQYKAYKKGELKTYSEEKVRDKIRKVVHSESEQ